MIDKRLFLLIAVLALQSCMTSKPAFKGEAFERYAAARDAGFDEKKLAELNRYIRDSALTTGLVVLYDGKLLYEYGDVQKVSYIASCRKSVLSMLYGKFVDNGTIDLNQQIGPLGIDEKDGLLPIEKTATIDHIITSRSGVFHLASNGGYDKDNFRERGSEQPGDYFVYNNWDFNVGGHILELYAKRSIYKEIEDQLAKPLGFQDWNIKNQKKSGNTRKSQYKAYHIYVSTRDMAKIGQLMLNEGEWEGQQLISREWIKKTTSTITPHETLVERYGPADPNGVHMSYGYMWWLVDNYQGKETYRGAYSATGYGGQFITVLPEPKLVIAHKKKLDLLTMAGIRYKGISDKVYYRIIDKILEAKL